MLTARIKIGESGTAVDSRTYGLVYLSSDNVVGAPTKEFEKTSYPEQEGVNVNPKTVDASFDYKITFFVQASDGQLGTANAKIKAFNDLILPKDANSDIRRAQRIWFYNDNKRHIIVGYPSPIAEAPTFWRDPTGQLGDVVVVDWNLTVNKPSDCDFSYDSSN